MNLALLKEANRCMRGRMLWYQMPVNGRPQRIVGPQVPHRPALARLSVLGCSWQFGCFLLAAFGAAVVVRPFEVLSFDARVHVPELLALPTSVVVLCEHRMIARARACYSETQRRKIGAFPPALDVAPGNFAFTAKCSREDTRNGQTHRAQPPSQSRFFARRTNNRTGPHASRHRGT